MTWLTSKIQASDVPVLVKLGRAGRLRDYVDKGYLLKRGPNAGTISPEIVPGTNFLDWSESTLMRKGMELGGKRTMTPTGQGIYKGLNVFPGRLIGEPMGFWDGSTVPNSLNLYRYQQLFDYEKLFVSREIAQLPTIAPVPPGAIFNNTVILIQLKERFPLNGWVLSRPVMFAAATCLRATVIEDLVCHWYPKNLGLLPVPLNVTNDELSTLDLSVQQLISADEDLANRWRSVEAAIVGHSTRTVSQLIADDSSITAGLVLPASEGDTEIPSPVEMTTSGLISSDGLYRQDVPSDDLRAFLWYAIHKLQVDDGSDVLQSYIGRCPIPVANLSGVASAIRAAHAASASEAFDNARIALDTISAKLLGLSDDDLAHIQERFLSDPFLSQIQPMWAHRGLHVQGYNDHSGGDRFA